MSIVFRGFLYERLDNTASQFGGIFFPVLLGSFHSQDVEARKDKTIVVLSVCADITISKGHGIEEVIP